MKSAGSCCRCKSEIWLPDSLHDAAHHSESISFWCPYGHEQHFVQGETEEMKLRRERDRLRQQIAQKDDEIAAERARAVRAERKTKRIERRAHAGLCPCCNRTFENVARHMRQKHPEQALTPTPAGIDLKVNTRGAA